MQPSTQYNNETCRECDAPATVTPDPYNNGSPFEFTVTCSNIPPHSFIRSYAHARPAPVFLIATPKQPKQPRPRRVTPPPTVRTPAQQSLIALLLKG